MTLFVLLKRLRIPWSVFLITALYFVIAAIFPRPPRCFSFRKLKEDTILGGKVLVMSLTPPPPSPYSLHGLSGEALVQSLNSPFFPPHIGAEPGRAKEESRITCMRMLRTNQSKITRSQPRCSRQCVAQYLSQLTRWKKTFSLTLILS